MLAGYPLAPCWVIILPASRASHFVTVFRWLLSLALLGCLGWEKGHILQLKILSQRVRCRYHLSEQLDSCPGSLGFLLGFLFPSITVCLATMLLLLDSATCLSWSALCHLKKCARRAWIVENNLDDYMTLTPLESMLKRTQSVLKWTPTFAVSVVSSHEKRLPSVFYRKENWGTKTLARY